MNSSTSAANRAMKTAAMLGAGIGGFEASSSFFLYPAIRGSIGNGNGPSSSWFLTIYGIVGAAILLQAGRLADRFGHHRLFVSGVTAAGVATLLVAVSPNLGWLIAARGLQAASLSIMGPSGVAIIIAASSPERRSADLGLYAAATGAAGMFGPALTAVLIDAASWRLPVLMLLPLVAVAAWYARSGWSVGHVATQRSASLDVAGSLAVMIGLASLVLGLLKGNAWGWLSSSTLGAGGLAVALLGAAVWRARRHADPAVPIDLFAYRAVRVGAVLGFLASVVFFAHWLALLGYMTGVWKYSATRAGIWLTLLPGMMMALATRFGRVADRVGFRRVMVPGAIVYAVGFSLFALTCGARPNITLLLVTVVSGGIGMATVWPLLTSVGTRGLAPARLATGAALLQTVVRIGGAIGSAAVVVLLDGSGASVSRHARPMWLLVIGGVGIAVVAALFARDRVEKPNQLVDQVGDAGR